MRPKAILCWSSGKDSAHALHRVRSAGELDVVCLLTTVTTVTTPKPTNPIEPAQQRVAVHAVRDALLDHQLRALGLPCLKVSIPAPCSNVIYEQRMRSALETAKGMGVTHVIFGDLFLEDLRAYREAMLRELGGLQAVFPLWTRDTHALAAEMIGSGLRARLSSLDPKKLPAALAGHEYDRALLDALPESVDSCGENGEFHSFAYAGPMFSSPIAVRTGEVVERDGFVYCDLLPA